MESVHLEAGKEFLAIAFDSPFGIVAVIVFGCGSLKGLGLGGLGDLIDGDSSCSLAAALASIGSIPAFNSALSLAASARASSRVRSRREPSTIARSQPLRSNLNDQDSLPMSDTNRASPPPSVYFPGFSFFKMWRLIVKRSLCLGFGCFIVLSSPKSPVPSRFSTGDRRLLSTLFGDPCGRRVSSISVLVARRR
jgi:hypothetical protein